MLRPHPEEARSAVSKDGRVHPRCHPSRRGPKAVAQDEVDLPGRREEIQVALECDRDHLGNEPVFEVPATTVCEKWRHAASPKKANEHDQDRNQERYSDRCRTGRRGRRTQPAAAASQPPAAARRLPAFVRDRCLQPLLACALLLLNSGTSRFMIPGTISSRRGSSGSMPRNDGLLFVRAPSALSPLGGESGRGG